jgi:hypothetical protein
MATQRRARKPARKTPARKTRPRKTSRRYPKNRRRMSRRLYVPAPDGDGMVPLLSEEKIAQARRKYEEGDETNAAIAAFLGISERPFDRLRAAQGWRPRRVAIPPELKAATRLHERALRLETEAPPPLIPAQAGIQDGSDGGHSEETGSPLARGRAEIPSAPPSAVAQVEQAVLEKLAALRAAQAQFRAMPANAPAWRHSAQTLDLLAKTLERLTALRRKEQPPAQLCPDCASPVEVEELRRSLCERLEALVARDARIEEAAAAVANRQQSDRADPA